MYLSLALSLCQSLSLSCTTQESNLQQKMKVPTSIPCTPCMHPSQLAAACTDCLHPKKSSNDDIMKESLADKIRKDNEAERKRLVSDLEKAGVSLPVAEFEAVVDPKMLHSSLSDGYTSDATNGSLAGNQQQQQQQQQQAILLEEALAKKAALTKADYATNMPDDLKDLLRRHYQGETTTDTPLVTGDATKSLFSDEESQSNQSVSSVGSVNASKSAFAKERTKKLRTGLMVSCLLLLGLISFAIAYPLNNKDNEEKEVSQLDELEEEDEGENLFEPIETESPTQSPTNMFSSSPTSQPTIEPCTDIVRVVQECYFRGESIVTSFLNCVPDLDDWLGLYPASADPGNLTDDTVAWMYTCGNKQCRGIVQSSLYTFQTRVPGTYRVHLIRERGVGPYEAYASSAEFEVKQNHLDCP